jgi:hypothetical protein
MNDTKACPFCGEQILLVALKCKHCGSALGTATPATTSSVATNQLKMRPFFVRALVVIIALTGVGWAYNWNQTGTISGKGFSDADISRIGQDIRSEFGKRPGMTVEEVQLLRESPRKLSGFAKVKVPLLGSISKTCTATMGDDGRSIWQCQ